MAVRQINHRTRKYVWDTADTKPTAASHGCQVGDTGYDRQTGIMYITYDGTNWVEKDTVVRLETSPTIDIGDVTLLASTAAIGKLAANSGIDIGDVDVTSIIDTLTTKLRHPFGKGALTTIGVQYCTPITGIDNSAYVAIETITIQQPTGMTLEEIEFGLTGALGASGATDAKLWKWQASDAGSVWEDLIAEQSQAALAAYADVTISGRFAPTGNFLGTGTSFQVRMVAKSAGATDTVNGKTKSSSYVISRYRRT